MRRPKSTAFSTFSPKNKVFFIKPLYKSFLLYDIYDISEPRGKIFGFFPEILAFFAVKMVKY